MLGLFDSGSGGLNTVRYIKEHYPEADVVYLIDRQNAPYGIKSEKELKYITEKNISELTERGAERVLIACCTAGTVYGLLGEEYKKVSIPIIKPVASEAKRLTKNRKIGVIGTNRTVSSHAFTKELIGFDVRELAAQELVAMIDSGLTDETAQERDVERISDILSPLFYYNIDTLILGCTHFPSLKQTIKAILSPLGLKNIINSAEIGAKALIST